MSFIELARPLQSAGALTNGGLRGLDLGLRLRQFVEPHDDAKTLKLRNIVGRGDNDGLDVQMLDLLAGQYDVESRHGGLLGFSLLLAAAAACSQAKNNGNAKGKTRERRKPIRRKDDDKACAGDRRQRQNSQVHVVPQKLGVECLRPRKAVSSQGL